MLHHQWISLVIIILHISKRGNKKNTSAICWAWLLYKVSGSDKMYSTGLNLPRPAICLRLWTFSVYYLLSLTRAWMLSLEHLQSEIFKCMAPRKLLNSRASCIYRLTTKIVDCRTCYKTKRVTFHCRLLVYPYYLLPNRWFSKLPFCINL